MEWAFGENVVDVFFAIRLDSYEPATSCSVGPIDTWDRLELIIILLILPTFGYRKPGEGATGFPGGEQEIWSHCKRRDRNKG